MAPTDDVQQIKDRLNIADVVGQYVQLKRAGRNLTARCPFHKERTPSFHVSPERGTYICFGCGEKGDIFSFVEKIESIDFKTALEELAKKAGVELHHTFTPKAENKEKDARIYGAIDAAAAFYEQELRKRNDVGEYLKNRGVTDETKAHWRLGYAPPHWRDLLEHLTSLGFTTDEIVDAGLVAKIEKDGESRVYDRFRGRAMFPIADVQGRIVAFSGRFFENVASDAHKAPSETRAEPAKYVNSPETVLFKKSRTLYGLDKAKASIRKADCILLVEGQFDVVLSHQSGLTFTVALSGTALTGEHLSLLSRLSKRLVLALDADEAGIRSGLKSALMAIEAGFDVKIPTFPNGKDPADVAKENPELLKAAVRTSKTAVEFFLDALRPAARDERVYKKNVERQVLPLIAAMQSRIEQEHFVRIVANRLGVSEGAVRAEVAKVKTQPQVEANATAPVPHLQESPSDPLEKKIAMLIAYFGAETELRAKLNVLVGAERIAEIESEYAHESEKLRFRFEQELGEHTSEAQVAADMLGDIERSIEKARFKMKFL
jgi:DNA primase